LLGVLVGGTAERYPGGEHMRTRHGEDRVLSAFAEPDDADGGDARLRGQVLPRRDDVLRLFPAVGLPPRGVALAGLVLLREVPLVGGDDVVSVGGEHGRPPHDRLFAMRVEAVDDDDARMLARV